LKQEHERLTREIRGVSAALVAFGAAYKEGNGTSKLLAQARQRMAAAQRARWAKVRNGGGQKQDNETSVPKEEDNVRGCAKENCGSPKA
jgi:hypothetical protein